MRTLTVYIILFSVFLSAFYCSPGQKEEMTTPSKATQQGLASSILPSQTTGSSEEQSSAMVQPTAGEQTSTSGQTSAGRTQTTDQTMTAAQTTSMEQIETAAEQTLTGPCTMGPAGGCVFYDKGEYSDGWRYLEAAPFNVGDGGYYPWGCYDVEIGKTGTAIGTGKSNTELIVNACPDKESAARLCDELVISHNGIEYDDWFLPSKEELNLMYLSLLLTKDVEISRFLYWSSSENSSTHAWDNFFLLNHQYYSRKDYLNLVRAVRAY